MNTFDWQTLLRTWNEEILASADVFTDLLPALVRSRCLGNPPASEEEVRRAESRLGAQLPPSYRAFLKVSNGWQYTGLAIQSLWSTEEIDWFAAQHQDFVDAWREGTEAYGGPPTVSDDEYLVYGANQKSHNIRDEYLETALEVSEVYDTEVYLLNPRVVTPDSEWEAWFFAHWLPGAVRYPSFWELMQAEHRRFLRHRHGAGR